jgi:hypothetical protein
MAGGMDYMNLQQANLGGVTVLNWNIFANWRTLMRHDFGMSSHDYGIISFNVVVM